MSVTLVRRDDPYITNPDMSGIAVVVSNIVLNFCLYFIIIYSPKEEATATHALLLQVYSILLSTLFSIGRNQLTVIDAHCAIRLATSPITLNLIWRCTGSLASRLRRKSYTYIKPAVIAFSVLLVPILFTLFTVISFSWTAFEDSAQYPHNVKQYIYDMIMLLLPIIWPMYLDPAYGGWMPFFAAFFQWSLFLTWVVYTARHARDIIGEWKDKKQESTSLWNQPIAAIKLIWHVIDPAHPWLNGFSIVSLLTSWAVGPIGILLETQHGYNFSYGQAISVFSTIPHLWSLLRLWYQERDTFLSMCRTLPRSFRYGVIFLITGNRNPWAEIKAAQDTGNGISQEHSVFQNTSTGSEDADLESNAVRRTRYPWYHVVDDVEGGRQVVDVWTPWKGWG